MVDKVNIELDNQFLEKFFAITERIIPEDQEITLLMLKRQLDEVEELISETKMKAQEAVQDALANVEKPAATPRPPEFNLSRAGENLDVVLPNAGAVLIIDDLGVITYQLAVLFKRLGFETVTSKEIYDAIEKYKKQSFDLVIMDLFIPTEREGFILLDEIKKCTLAKGAKTVIGVMSASSKKEHKQLCKAKGAEFYLEKVDDWQKELCSVINNISVESESV